MPVSPGEPAGCVRLLDLVPPSSWPRAPWSAANSTRASSRSGRVAGVNEPQTVRPRTYCDLASAPGEERDKHL